MLRKVLSTAVFAATAAVSLNAAAIGRLADVAVIDRSTGQMLPVHFFKGEYWVAGTPGAKYSISVANSAGSRMMAVMSVDGVNVLNGQTAGVEPRWFTTLERGLEVPVEVIDKILDVDCCSRCQHPTQVGAM